MTNRDGKRIAKLFQSEVTFLLERRKRLLASYEWNILNPAMAALLPANTLASSCRKKKRDGQSWMTTTDWQQGPEFVIEKS